MINSDQLDQLFAALSAAQIEFADVLKDKVADMVKFKYKYADLADTISATKPALAKHGLAVTQLVSASDGTLAITTLLGHSSGQYIGDRFEAPSKGLDMREVGGLITYARRYSYTAILGIAADVDDDAAQATAAQRQRAPAPAPAPEHKAADAPKPAAARGKDNAPGAKALTLESIRERAKGYITAPDSAARAATVAIYNNLCAQARIGGLESYGNDNPDEIALGTLLHRVVSLCDELSTAGLEYDPAAFAKSKIPAKVIG